MLTVAQEKFDALAEVFGKPQERGTSIPPELVGPINQFFDIYCTVPPALKGLEREYHMLTKFLRGMSLRMNQDDLDSVFGGRDNVFEIYSFDHKQIYRSDSFLRFVTYPMMTLMLKSNFELYSREEDYVPMLQEQLGEFAKTLKLMKLTVPAHKVWESAKGANHTYHWLMDLGSCAPVYDLSGAPAAVLITHRTEQVFRSPFLELVENTLS